MPKNITHDIGSLAKPAWRVKAVTHQVLTDQDVQEASFWGKKLEIPDRELLEVLQRKQNFSEEEIRLILKFSSLYALKLLDHAGLDWVWDGEQQRIEMYEYPIAHIEGFEFRGHVRSFDNKYFKKATCVSLPKLKTLYHVDELKTLSQMTTKPIKIPITGAYTLMDWSYDDFYRQGIPVGSANIFDKRKEGRRLFALWLAKNIIRPNLRALYQQGVKYIQIDEPAATSKKDEIPLFIETIKESIGDLAGKVFFTLHICFSDYSFLFPGLNDLQGLLDEVHFEFANKDSKELGSTAKKRKGYEVIEQFLHNRFYVGLGVIDVHSDFIESPELIRDRIEYAAQILGDLERIMIAPDCGLRTRSWKVAFEKLSNMVKARDLIIQT